MRFLPVLLSFLLSCLYFTGLSSQQSPESYLFAQCTFSSMLNPLSIDSTALLLKSEGYKGIEAWSERNLDETLAAAKKAGIMLSSAYTPLYFHNHKGFSDYKKSVKETISKCSTGTYFCFHIPEIETDISKRIIDKLLAETLREFTLFAEEYGVKTCVYPHNNSYCETVKKSVELSKKVRHDNCGAMITLCHLLKAEGSDKADKIVKKYGKHLFLATISGADKGDTKEMEMSRLIQPLGEGSYDTYKFMKLLWDNGFSGPVGIQFYGIKKDAREVIRQGAAKWNEYILKYGSERDL